MSKRLQVVISEREMSEIQRLAKLEHMTVAEWVRQAMREARSGKPMHGPEAKLKTVRHAAGYSFPTADIERMLQEIERGYQA